MNFKNKQKTIKMKKQFIKYCGNVWYAIVYPLAFMLDKYSKFKRKRMKNKINKLTIYEASCLMAKHILKELAERPKLDYGLYVCDSEYHSDSFPTTIVDYLLYELQYSKGKYQILYKWAWDMHYNRKLNGVWLNGVMAEVIYDELSNIEGLKVYWEYDEELTKSIRGKIDYPNYQKHLVIKVKE